MTDFRLLGPVEVWTAAGRLDTGPPQRRLVLAALLAEPARLVTAETLITRVWGEQPPAGARRALHVHIARIRRMLRPAALARGSGGYVLEIDPDRVDLHRFRCLTARAAEPGRAGSERLALLREALAQWRGAPLAGLPGHWADQVRENSSRRHADAVIAWAHAEIDAGDPGAAVDALTELAEDYPLVEPVTAALMLALHRSGRSAEALDCYARARRRLVDELGIEPGAELAELHRAVLRGDAGPPAPAPTVAARTASDTPAAAPQSMPESALTSAGPFPAVAAVPVQLPPDVPGFAGRRTELATLTAAAAERALVVVSGTAGVGKPNPGI